jgi:parallel beta-helix repeat protein
LSGNTGGSRVAIDIDGGSSGTVVSGVTVLSGRIIAAISPTNGGSAPTQLTIRHNTLTSAVTGGTAGGAIDINSGTSHFIVAENRINGNVNGSNPGNGAGISVESGSSYGEIVGNDSYANAGSGIYLLSGLYLSVVGNNCSGNHQSGIGVNSASAPYPGRLSITGNTCNGNTYDGIDINEASGPQFIYINVQGNFLASNGPPPGGGGTGINLNFAVNVTVSSNTIFNNATAGINIVSCQNIAVTGNTVASNSQSNHGGYPGIYVSASSYSTFSGNISTNNGGTPSQSYGIQELGGSNWNTYSGNNTQNNISGGLSISGAQDQQAANL